MTLDLNRKKVLLRGPVLTQSGYGVHARQVARWLLSQPQIDLKVQAMMWGETPWIIDRSAHDGLIGSLIDRTIEPTPGSFDVSFQLQLPNEWDTKLAKFNVGLTAGVETDRCNPAWIDNCNSMDHIVVPSRHVESCLRMTGNVTTPISVIPEAYTDAIVKNVPTRVNDIKFSTSFNFLMIGQLTGNNPENDRKNLFYSIKWLCETFSEDSDVGLVIKTNFGRNTSIDRQGVTHALKKLLSEVRSTAFPKIHLVHGGMSDEEVASLYRHPQIKAFLAPTRGEGFGLPILEAAASGLPVISTGWSGHTDFLSHGKSVELAYKLQEIHQTRIDGKIFMQGAKWAQPVEEDFKTRLLKFKKSSNVPRQWAEELRQKIVPLYSQIAIEKEYNEKLKGIL